MRANLAGGFDWRSKLGRADGDEGAAPLAAFGEEVLKGDRVVTGDTLVAGCPSKRLSVIDLRLRLAVGGEVCGGRRAWSELLGESRFGSLLIPEVNAFSVEDEDDAEDGCECE